MNILITGGTGFVGEELQTRLLQEGHYLALVSRNPDTYESEKAKNLRYVGWGEDLAEEMESADAVINLAGENIFGQRWNGEVKQRIRDSRVESTRKLVEAMDQAENRPEVFISASAAGIYGDRGDSVVDESADAADDFQARVCREWEAEARKAEALGLRVVTPRMGIVLEKGGGALKQMIPPFKFGVGGPVGDGTQYMPWVHRSDLVSAMVYFIQNKEAKGAYNVCSPEQVTMNEFAHTLAEVMNRPSLFRVPEFALKIAFGEGAQPITDSIRMQPKKLQTEGFKFRFENLREALADIL